MDRSSEPLPADQCEAPRVAGVRCDIGAVEYGAVADPIFADEFQ